MSNSKGSVKVDNLVTVHVLKYDGKEIPVYFNKELIMDRLVEATTIIDLFKHYLSENNIECTDINKKTFMASEAVSSAFIEGYETYIPAEFIVKGLIPSTKDERAIVSGYNASLLLNSLDTGVDVNSLLRVWRKLIKYKPFLRKNFRHCGVKVGNKFKTVHVAPNKKYVKDMLHSMFNTLDAMSFDWDGYNLLKSIVFHYIFTYIHPFVDGNGRCSRLFENYYLMLSTGIPYFCQISNIILRNKSKYYKSFNSGKVYSGDDLSCIDITEFINVNLYFITQGYASVLEELKKGELISESIDASLLSNREQIMMKEIMKCCTGISVKNYKYLWNKIASENKYKKIGVEDAEKDISHLFDLGFLTVDERYVNYPGFKYYNK